MEPEYFLVCTGAARVTRRCVSINPTGYIYIPKFLVNLYRLADKKGAELMISRRHHMLGIRFLDKPTEKHHYRPKPSSCGGLMILAPAFLEAFGILSKKHRLLFMHDWDEERNVLIIRLRTQVRKNPRTLKRAR